MENIVETVRWFYKFVGFIKMVMKQTKWIAQ